MLHNRSLWSPNRMTARELWELYEDGASRTASSIRLATSVVESGNDFPREY
jgi:hypothetical protein